ncbi:insulin-like growth factor 2 mRNA-binding protein 3-B isoform X3 [Euwallacea fornicatus]|uniref:insulin-like growth factor 2 mRNA-binding protein 3-B isoform X3 n=1 Tax=Euwallacea fornicatus TaxID=995702 RepID=UPI00338DD54D
MSVTKIPPITMSKLYVGNLPLEVSEKLLRQLFVEQGLSCTNIMIKRGGYAFVDCPDQSAADRAIDKLNGFNFHGSLLVVEPSVTAGKRRSFPDTPPMQVAGRGWIQKPTETHTKPHPRVHHGQTRHN